jgi:hypothetical protein
MWGYAFLLLAFLLAVAFIYQMEYGRKPQESRICIQVVTTAKNTQTGEVKNFPTPCDVPEGWEAVNINEQTGNSLQLQSQKPPCKQEKAYATGDYKEIKEFASECDIPNDWMLVQEDELSRGMVTYKNAEFGYEITYDAKYMSRRVDPDGQVWFWPFSYCECFPPRIEVTGRTVADVENEIRTMMENSLIPETYSKKQTIYAGVPATELSYGYEIGASMKTFLFQHNGKTFRITHEEGFVNQFSLKLK